MIKNKAILSILALTIAVGAFFFPLTAQAQTSDTTSPTVTVEIKGDMLKVTAKDNESGVAAIYINGYRFSTLVNGTANVKLKDYAGTGKQIEIYATDTAGNKSQPVMMDNPYYKAPVQQTTPTSTPTQTTTPTTPGPTAKTPQRRLRRLRRNHHLPVRRNLQHHPPHRSQHRRYPNLNPSPQLPVRPRARSRTGRARSPRTAAARSWTTPLNRRARSSLPLPRQMGAYIT